MAQTRNYTRGPKAKCWSFQYNNYPENIEEMLRAKKGEFNYLVAGKCESNDPQRKWLHGYVVFKSQKRLHQV